MKTVETQSGVNRLVKLVRDGPETLWPLFAAAVILAAGAVYGMVVSAAPLEGAASAVRGAAFLLITAVLIIGLLRYRTAGLAVALGAFTAFPLFHIAWHSPMLIRRVLPGTSLSLVLHQPTLFRLVDYGSTAVGAMLLFGAVYLLSREAAAGVYSGTQGLQAEKASKDRRLTALPRLGPWATVGLLAAAGLIAAVHLGQRPDPWRWASVSIAYGVAYAFWLATVLWLGILVWKWRTRGSIFLMATVILATTATVTQNVAYSLVVNQLWLALVATSLMLGTLYFIQDLHHEPGSGDTTAQRLKRA